jgi:hypothetical protein
MIEEVREGIERMTKEKMGAVVWYGEEVATAQEGGQSGGNRGRREGEDQTQPPAKATGAAARERQEGRIARVHQRPAHPQQLQQVRTHPPLLLACLLSFLP